MPAKPPVWPQMVVSGLLQTAKGPAAAQVLLAPDVKRVQLRPKVPMDLDPEEDILEREDLWPCPNEFYMSGAELDCFGNKQLTFVSFKPYLITHTHWNRLMELRRICSRVIHGHPGADTRLQSALGAFFDELVEWCGGSEAVGAPHTETPAPPGRRGFGTGALDAEPDAQAAAVGAAADADDAGQRGDAEDGVADDIPFEPPFGAEEPDREKLVAESDGWLWYAVGKEVVDSHLLPHLNILSMFDPDIRRRLMPQRTVRQTTDPGPLPEVGVSVHLIAVRAVYAGARGGAYL